MCIRDTLFIIYVVAALNLCCQTNVVDIFVTVLMWNSCLLLGGVVRGVTLGNGIITAFWIKLPLYYGTAI